MKEVDILSGLVWLGRTEVKSNFAAVPPPVLEPKSSLRTFLIIIQILNNKTSQWELHPGRKQHTYKFFETSHSQHKICNDSHFCFTWNSTNTFYISIILPWIVFFYTLSPLDVVKYIVQVVLLKTRAQFDWQQHVCLLENSQNAEIQKC